MAYVDPVKGAFNFDLWGWDVRELRLLQRFLTPGMTVIDVGAHHGLYAILAARQVGATGRVIAFEPAPSVRRRLRWHLRLNGTERGSTWLCTRCAENPGRALCPHRKSGHDQQPAATGRRRRTNAASERRGNNP